LTTKSKKKPFVNIKIFGWTSILFLSLLACANQKILFIYCDYAGYRLASLGNEKDEANGHIARMISSAKEAGYTCLERLPQGITLERKDLSRSHPYSIAECVILPTGEVILRVDNSISRNYLLLNVDESKPGGYYILHIGGETIG
jgi:hypothetical protein